MKKIEDTKIDEIVDIVKGLDIHQWRKVRGAVDYYFKKKISNFENTFKIADSDEFREHLKYILN